MTANINGFPVNGIIVCFHEMLILQTNPHKLSDYEHYVSLIDHNGTTVRAELHYGIITDFQENHHCLFSLNFTDVFAQFYRC